VNLNSTISIASSGTLLSQVSLNVDHGKIQGNGSLVIDQGSDMDISDAGVASLGSNVSSDTGSIFTVRDPSSLFHCSVLSMVNGSTLSISNGGKVDVTTLNLNATSTLTINAGHLRVGVALNN